MKRKYVGQSYALRVAGLILLAVISFTVASLSCAAAEQSAPSEVIKGFNAALLESMKKAGELGYSGRYKLLEPVIKESFAVPFMASASVGSYWKTLGEKDRKIFLDSYIEWTIATYAGRFNDYSGERFEVTSESRPLRGTVTVVSKLIQSNDEQIDFHYNLRKIDALWRIVDIQISGVSQLALTRSQFVSVIKNKGFDALISVLKEKTSYFSQGKER
jgi:phospholipid transport system substrate-binding protein